MSKEVDITDFKLLDGVGPAGAKELKSGRYITISEVAASSIEELIANCNINKDKAEKYQSAALKYLEETGLLNSYISSGLEDLTRREQLKYISTNSTELNKLLHGGIETGACTEFYGEYGSGKSQICHMAAVNATLPLEKGGLDGKVIYIDTEGTFRPERIKQICENLDENWKDVLANIQKIRAYNSAHLLLQIANLPKYVQQFNAKLIVIDSIISIFRAEKIGMGNLAARQQLLGQLLHKVGRTIDVYQVACIITNQVQADPAAFSPTGRPKPKPVGGNTLGHFSTYRVFLDKSGEKRKATMIDSPNGAYETVLFSITEKGIVDYQDKKKKVTEVDEDTE